MTLTGAGNIQRFPLIVPRLSVFVHYIVVCGGGAGVSAPSCSVFIFLMMKTTKKIRSEAVTLLIIVPETHFVKCGWYANRAEPEYYTNAN
jgi:hypothetical protein